ncbi:MAG: hypothetical protein KatS3mg024_0213 [Armatimonadota bacterium]|nr:MAG: hypothetical protein KatS3mg024_0213 [Armatimonadota bacterium]
MKTLFLTVVLVAMLATVVEAQYPGVLVLRDEDRPSAVDYVQVTYYAPNSLTLTEIPAPPLSVSLNPSPSVGWEVFGGWDVAGRLLGWASGPASRVQSVTFCPNRVQSPLLARVQGYLGPTKQWDYYITRSSAYEYFVDVMFWWDARYGWMEYRVIDDQPQEVPVEDPGNLRFLNTPIARAVAPVVPEPPLVQMGIMVGFGMLGLLRARCRA